MERAKGNNLTIVWLPRGDVPNAQVYHLYDEDGITRIGDMPLGGS